MRIAVAGHSRRIGKTAVICGIVRALPEARWTAIKISPHAHAAASAGDTARYLDAGAREALLLACAPDPLPGGNVILESGSVPDLLAVDLRLFVLDLAKPEFKSRARRALAQADAVVVTCLGEFSSLSGPKPVFFAPAPDYTDPALIECIRRQMGPGRYAA